MIIEILIKIKMKYIVLFLVIFLLCINVKGQLIILEPNYSDGYPLQPNSTYKFEMFVQGHDNLCTT